MSKPFLEVEVTARDTDEPSDDNLTGVRERVSDFAKVSGEALVTAVRDTVDLIGEAFTPSKDGPESCSVKFGLKVTGTGNVILAKMGSELNIEVTVTWKR